MTPDIPMDTNTPSPKRRTLLLIEDNPLLVGMYQAAFAEHGVAALMATDGETGIALAAEHQPDLIVLDLLMPGMSGFDVIAALQRSPKTKDIRIVVLTVVTDDAAREKCKALGVADYLIKPDLRLAEIVERVMAHL